MSNRENIAKNIVSVLTDMSPPRPNLVTREPFDVEKLAITQFPAILVQTGREDKESVTMGAIASGRRTGSILYVIRAYVRGTELDRRRNEIIERIEEALDSDRYRDLSTTVLDSQIIGIEVIERLPPLAEVNIEFRVNYSYLRGTA